MAGTQNFGLERFGPEGRISQNNYKFSDKDRQTIDALLYTLFQHDHREVAQNVQLAGPLQRADLAVVSTGGTIGSGQDLYYRIAFVDSTGNETEASVASIISTGDRHHGWCVGARDLPLCRGFLSDRDRRHTCAKRTSHCGAVRHFHQHDHH
jgi:hypothetical protein